METYQIVAGFSDIKSELRKRSNLNKEMREISLWFSLKQEMLFVHDFQNDEKVLFLASFNRHKKVWRIFLNSNGFGKKLIEEAVSRAKPEEVATILNDLFRSYGFGIF